MSRSSLGITVSPFRAIALRFITARHAAVPIIIILLVTLFIGLPQIVVLSGLLRPANEAWIHIRSTLLLDYILDTLLLGCGVTLGATLIGTGLAWFTSNYEFPGVRFFSWAIGLPIALPAYISAYTYAYVTGITGPLFRTFRWLFGRQIAVDLLFDIMSLPGCIFIMVFALYPYIYFSARSFFSGSSRHYIETARACGRSDAEIFFRVALPVARPAIIAGASLVLMETLNEYGATSYFGVQSMVTGIYRAWFSHGDVGSALRLSGFFLIGIAVLLVFERKLRRRRRYHHGTLVPQSRYRPSMLSGYLMCLVCFVSLALGLIVPLTQLIFWCLRSIDLDALDRLRGAISRSFLLSGAGSAICLAVSVLLIFLLRNRKGVTLTNEIVGSGYAVPGAIIGVGVLTLAGTIRSTFSVYLIGSVGLLLYAYVVRYLSITMKPLQAGIEKIPASFDDAGALSGRPWMSIFAQVHLPLLRPALSAGLFMVFIDLLKELPMSLVLRPFNFDTLATRAFELAQQDRLREAALPSVVIVLVGLIPALILSKRRHIRTQKLDNANDP